MSRCFFVLLASVVASATMRPAAQSNALFAFHSNSVPSQLWHAVLFYTAGELTTRELKAHGIANTPYAGQGLYTNLCGAGCREKIREYWTPHLDGKRSIADSLSGLVASFK